jgi:hypothetical protein
LNIRDRNKKRNKIIYYFEKEAKNQTKRARYKKARKKRFKK